MNQKSFKCKILFAISAIILSNGFLSATNVDYSLDYELKKKYVKEYSTDQNTMVEISNRYGKVEIKTWEKETVKIDVTVIVKASDKKRADDKMKEISILASKNGNTVSATTEISNSNQSWWSTWWNSDGNIKVEINYDVYMPAHLRSIIENKYGNIILPDLSGKTSVNLKYGNLQAKNIDADLLLDLSYGKATIGTVKNMSATIAYSDLRGTSSGTTTLTTKYSKIYLDKARTLTVSSKYDTYKIGSTNSITMTGGYDDIEIEHVTTGIFNLKYSGFEIGSLSQSLTTDISYGSMTVQSLKSSFTRMTVNTSYAPIKVYGAVPCKIDVSGKYFDVDLGADFISQQKINDGNTKNIKGYKGNDRTGASILITSKYGDVVIK